MSDSTLIWLGVFFAVVVIAFLVLKKPDAPESDSDWMWRQW